MAICLFNLSDPFFSYGDTLEVLTSHKTKIVYELMVCYNMTQGHFGKLKVTGKKSEKNLTCYTFLCRNIWSSYLRIRLLMNLVCVIILIEVQECKLKVIVNYQYHQKCSVHVVKRAVNHIVFCPIWKLTIDRITPHCESCFFLLHGSCARFNQDSARWLEIM